MYEYRYGGKTAAPQTLESTDEFVAVRVQESAVESLESAITRLPETDGAIFFEEEGLMVFRPSSQGAGGALRNRVLESMDDEEDVLPEDRVLKDASGAPVVYTDKIFVKFSDDASSDDIDDALAPYSVVGRESFKMAPNAYFVALGPDVGSDVFRIANALLDDDRVEYAHPELLREQRFKNATRMQWHLRPITRNGASIDQHCNAPAAWKTSRGEGVVIAVIDDGVDVDHREFDGKVVDGYDATRNREGGAPRRFDDDHGTACAGVACAAGTHRASGVAPDAKLMPIRFRSGLGSRAEARAFEWAVDKGADVISCSWGPPDGRWWDPADPSHQTVYPLPDSSRLSLDYAAGSGRDGKGCVIVWAAGNGNESADNDGYASYDKVIAVAACNDRGTRSVYSDFGASIWCAFPSGDAELATIGHPAPLTPGIWTTDRRGAQGYNPGHTDPVDDDTGDSEGNYTATFGGTSSACPGVAGLAALILSVDPDLTWSQVKEIIKDSCVKIDPAGGDYDAQGHSRKYGYGRVDAAAAVALAKGYKP